MAKEIPNSFNLSTDEMLLSRKIRDQQKSLIKSVADGSKKKHRPGEDIAMVGAFQETQMLKSEVVLHEAARQDNVDVVKRLIGARINVNSTNNLDRTPVQWAAASGSKEAMKVLLDAGADIEAYDKYGMRPVLWSAWYDKLNTLQFLIASGAEVDCVNKQGFSMLHCAANQDAKLCIDYIFEALDEGTFQLDICATENHGRDVIHLAAKEGHVESLEKLLKRVKSVNLKDKNGETALHLAATDGHTICVEKLSEAGFNLDETNELGKTALYLAAESGHIQTVECLLTAKANPDAKTAKQQTALLIAASLGYVGVTRALLAHGRCSINIQNESGNTALHLAAMGGFRPIISDLIANNCKINLPNYRMLTPLHSAVEKGIPDTVEELLISGADTYVREKGGRTALYMAARESFIGIVDMIIKSELYRDTLKEYYQKNPMCPAEPPAEPPVEPVEDGETAVEPIEPIGPESTEPAEPENPYRDIYKIFRHPHAGIMKPILFKLAHKQFSSDDWEKLARHWKFDEEHIGAIRHQYSGDQSYREHGYRMLLIWLFGMEPDANPMKEMYESLVAIDKKTIAERVRRKIQAQCGGQDKTSCTVS